MRDVRLFITSMGTSVLSLNGEQHSEDVKR